MKYAVWPPGFPRRCLGRKTRYVDSDHLGQALCTSGPLKRFGRSPWHLAPRTSRMNLLMFAARFEIDAINHRSQAYQLVNRVVVGKSCSPFVSGMTTQTPEVAGPSKSRKPFFEPLNRNIRRRDRGWLFRSRCVMKEGHGDIGGLRRADRAARGDGSPGAGRARAAALGCAGVRVSLSAVQWPVRPVSAPCRGAGGDLGRAGGLDGGSVQGRRPGRLDRLDAGAAVPAAEADRQQQPLRDSGRQGRDAQPGVAGAGSEFAAAVAGHARGARFSGSAGGDVRGSVALRGHLLPGVELADAGAHARLHAAAGQPGSVARERTTEGGPRV